MEDEEAFFNSLDLVDFFRWPVFIWLVVDSKGPNQLLYQGTTTHDTAYLSNPTRHITLFPLPLIIRASPQIVLFFF